MPTARIMHAASYLSDPKARSRLDSAVGPDYRILCVSSWSELDQVIRSEPIEIVIVNPCRSGRCEVAPVERLRAYYPSLSVVLYMPFSPDLADALLRLGGVGVHSAVFMDHGDTEVVLRRALDEAAACSTSELILRQIRQKLELEDAEIIDAFRAALRNVCQIRTAKEWSKFLDLSHRSFYRLFSSSGMPTPKTCLLWLRLIYAARLLEDPGYSLYDVVHRLGYSAPSNFWQHVQDILGLRASELRYAVGFEVLLDRFVAEHAQERAAQQSAG